MMTCPELFVLRHGETEWNVQSRLQGHLDSPLTALGVQQAKAQGQILRRLDVLDLPVLASPSPRAMRTAELALPDTAIEPDARLMEIGLGDWTGQTLDDIAATTPHVAQDTDPHLWKFSAPGGESLEDMVARCRSVLDRLTGPTILVTHGVTSRVLRSLALGLPPECLSDLPGGQGVVHHLGPHGARVVTA